MINNQTLRRIIGDLEQGRMIMPGEVQLLREAVDLLSDLVDMVDKIVGPSRYNAQYEREATGAMPIFRPES